MPPRLLQLVPPRERLSLETGLLVERVARVADGMELPGWGRTKRVRVERPWWELGRMWRAGYQGAGIVQVVGSAVPAGLGRAGRGMVRVLYTPEGVVGKGEARMLRGLGSGVQCLAASVYGAGLVRGRTGLRCGVCRPEVGGGGVSVDREGVRRALGIGPENKVVLAVGDSTLAANHSLGLWATGILMFLDTTWRFVIRGTGSMAGSVEKFAATGGMGERCVVASEVMGRVPGHEELIAAADYALDTATGATDQVPLRMCLARGGQLGLPVLGTSGPAAREWMDEADLLPAGASPREIARRILDLEESAALREACVRRGELAGARGCGDEGETERVLRELMGLR